VDNTIEVNMTEEELSKEAQAITERRFAVSKQDLERLDNSIHTLDVRVAVMEVRLNTQDERLFEIKGDIKDAKENTQLVLTKLVEHASEETRDRSKFLRILIVTMITVIASAILPNLSFEWLVDLFKGVN